MKKDEFGPQRMKDGTRGQHPCFLFQVVFRGEGVQSRDATIILHHSFRSVKSYLCNFKNFTNFLVSEKIRCFDQSCTEHYKIVYIKRTWYIFARNKSMEVGPALILLTTPLELFSTAKVTTYA